MPERIRCHTCRSTIRPGEAHMQCTSCRRHFHTAHGPCPFHGADSMVPYSANQRAAIRIPRTPPLQRFVPIRPHLTNVAPPVQDDPSPSLTLLALTFGVVLFFMGIQLFPRGSKEFHSPYGSPGIFSATRGVLYYLFGIIAVASGAVAAIMMLANLVQRNAETTRAALVITAILCVVAGAVLLWGIPTWFIWIVLIIFFLVGLMFFG